MSVLLSPIGNGFQFFDANGRPLSGGFIYTYQAGSTTPATTYTTNAGTIANTNPIVLGSDGRPPQEIWLTSGTSYKFVLTDSTNVVIGTYDNLYGIVNSAPVANPIPSGSIIMWSGSIGAIPAGYYLCDGNNGTPDLRDRFVVGSGNSYAVGNTGGFTSSVTSSIGTNLPLYYSLAFIQKS
jgi:hypothetical protein